MSSDKIYKMKFSKIYPLLVNKAVKKGRTKQEVDTIIHRLLKVDREDVTVDVGYKKQIIEAGLRPKESYKDIIAVEYKIPKE